MLRAPFAANFGLSAREKFRDRSRIPARGDTRRKSSSRAVPFLGRRWNVSELVFENEARGRSVRALDFSRKLVAVVVVVVPLPSPPCVSRRHEGDSDADGTPYVEDAISSGLGALFLCPLIVIVLHLPPRRSSSRALLARFLCRSSSLFLPRRTMSHCCPPCTFVPARREPLRRPFRHGRPDRCRRWINGGMCM